MKPIKPGCFLCSLDPWRKKEGREGKEKKPVKSHSSGIRGPGHGRKKKIKSKTIKEEEEAKKKKKWGGRNKERKKEINK